MTVQESLVRDVSDTALWTAAYRADESERPDALFVDPYARRLAGERGREIAAAVKQQAVRFGVVLRTAVLDELIPTAICERKFDAVLNLAAGLDSRPYRMDLPRDLSWIEVDMPGVVAHKERVLAAEEPRCRLKRVPLDLSDREARRGLFAHVAAKCERVLILTEGLLGYLHAEEVSALAEDLHRQEPFAEWMTDVIGANVVPRLRNTGDRISKGVAPFRFAPEEGTAFFEPYGWRETEFHDLFVESAKMGRDGALGKLFRVLMRLLPEEKRRRLERGIGIATLERS